MSSSQTSQSMVLDGKDTEFNTSLLPRHWMIQIQNLNDNFHARKGVFYVGKTLLDFMRILDFTHFSDLELVERNENFRLVHADFVSLLNVRKEESFLCFLPDQISYFLIRFFNLF